MQLSYAAYDAYAYLFWRMYRQYNCGVKYGKKRQLEQVTGIDE